MEKISCPPDAGRTITGFRDTGYTLYTAVADIVDNSIVAQADNIWIEIDKDPSGQVHVRIADDGYGMTPDELFKAMQYGSPAKAEGNQLGRFGLGLKTASTSVCRQLTVVTRKSKKSDLHAARWDVDLVSSEGDWLLQRGQPEKSYTDDFTKLIEDSGTMVCWDTVDRLGTHDDLHKTEISNNVLGAYIRRLREHLELVYHRFMEAGKIKIHLNGEELVAWDPFARHEKTEHVLERKFDVKLPGSQKNYSVTMNVYVIPNKYEYSTDGARDRTRISNNRQGFYVYREGRVIIAGEWLGMYVQEPHLSLLRAELSFPRELDELFSLDIKKSTLTLNPGLYSIINKEIDPVRRIADRRYRQGKKHGLKQKGSPHEQSQGLLNAKYKEATENLEVKKIGKNQVQITNVDGTTVISMPTVETPGLKELIQVVDDLEHGLFWEPALINNRLGVRINRNHIYYERVYVPNYDDSVTVRGIDSILWALAKCEQEVMNKDVRKKLNDLRFQVSRTLHELAEELPEPMQDDD